MGEQVQVQVQNLQMGLMMEMERMLEKGQVLAQMPLVLGCELGWDKVQELVDDMLCGEVDVLSTII
jgi:hypothetical protein